MTDSRWFSTDLAQWRLEIPCVLRFQGVANHTAKAKKLIESALATTTTASSASKKRKQSDASAELPSTSDHKDSTLELLVRNGYSLQHFVVFIFIGELY